MGIDIVDNKTTQHKLTVTGDNRVRIKIAKGSSPEHRQAAITFFTNVVNDKELQAFPNTMRGNCKLGNLGVVVLYNENKSKRLIFLNNF